ncbi:RND superfamily drug exporter [Corynebacterium suranareeae]|uniref:RND superfamily drug exporter n=1 Tax=Corynebacterium suranareeae TaxID=2506452 RepID=A0A161JNF1_9CORY|nr:MMPL family transporter [Corynebacterium suranareeae]BAU94312.1 RND superfamily drug exporter [Corynebacterium suranareeae]
MTSSLSTKKTGKKPPTWLRIFLPMLLILLWFAGAGIGGPYFGKVSEVSSNDQTLYLPESADASRVQQLIGEFNDSDAVPAVVVLVGDDQLSGEKIKQLNDAFTQVLGINGVSEQASPLIPSEDGRALEAFVPIDSSADISDVVDEINAMLSESVPDGVQSYVTGPAGFAADLGEAFSGIDGLLLMVALAAVFVILIVVYRSFLLPIAVLSTSLFALTVALLTVWWLAKWDILLLSGQTQGILFILVIGAATDYSLLYVARYREELRVHRDKWVATLNALKASVEPIVASGSTVIAGLLCLLFSDLKSNSTLGPVAAIGIVFAMLAALTLLPAILFAFGRVAFWPKRPKYEPEVVAQEDGMPSSGVWAKVGALVQKYPRRIWVGTLIVLMLGVVAVPQLKADGVAQSELVLGTSAARDGQDALGEHFPGGSGSPVYVVADQGDVSQVMEVLEGNEFLEGGEASTSVVDGQVLVQATLTVAQDSEAAQEAVRGLRADLAEQAIDAQVGGVTATAIDTNDASTHDRNLIIPVVLIVILLILMALLRSIVAPVLLILSTVVSFGTAMGVSALVFNHLFDFPGADPAVPLFGFVFLVALGIDYNIFLATRIREESKAYGTREGIIRGLVATGGVITSAGLVLAATFAALSVIPILFLAQLAFIVAFGVLLDTFLVRAFLVPALFYDIGKKIWWPSKLGSQDN